MARVPLVIAMSHSPFLYMPPQFWNQIRARRSYRDEVPYESVPVSASPIGMGLVYRDDLRS